ncbi:DNA polymerase IV [Anaerotruncus sp. 2789STDY5834896]|uniref:DNA polymerase IV n=1 Tax=uncultured Anaerotruncus sp. TaxID=905011 RepID=A0A1C6FZD9_9FIRM|nr:DNA polymerase IV [uncultured Anaerotruncus sp.]
MALYTPVMTMERTILHADLNNFYASVECVYRPQLRGKPVAVAGDAQLRHGIVLAKSYEARACDVQTGDPLWLARQKCPEIVFVPPDYGRYLHYSQLVRQIYLDYTDLVEPYGLDECWLDVTGSARLFGRGSQIAAQLRRRVKKELGVTISVGVSFNRVFAKLGSDLKKPDAITVLPPNCWRERVWPLPVQDLIYVGRATESKLARMGIHTIGQLAAQPPALVQQKLGKVGVLLWGWANGCDRSQVQPAHISLPVKSIGNSTTAPRDLVTDRDARITLYALCDSVAARLRAQHLTACTVQLTIRDCDLWSYQRQTTLKEPCQDSQTLFDAAHRLFCRHRLPGRPARGLGVKACNLALQTPPQLSLYGEIQRAQRQTDLECALDGIRAKYGNFAVRRGIMLTDPALAAVDPQRDHIIYPVGFLGG